jgi:phenol hydroxylase P0 protein
MTMETPLNPALEPVATPGLDAIKTDAATLARRYVRITNRADNGIVAFEFSVGWPDMSVELALPEPQFNEFCSTNNVEFLTEAVGEKLGDPHDEH